MNWKEPTAELHASGWGAVVLIALLVVSAIEGFGWVLLYIARAIRMVIGA